ncbi:hypothetical protein [uncultured Alistipes sp.]|uniref:hypothetical protein n=1 Tax=uncultured Alistipes sp. TaxID=538949 RepID=UPI002591F6E6|nr:hypothetical protein [uncultured Alistipes sp.]
MLDAAHGAPDTSAAHAQRRHAARGDTQDGRTMIAGNVGRRRPIIAFRTDSYQSSLLAEAVARSRHSKAIAGMNGKKMNNE